MTEANTSIHPAHVVTVGHDHKAPLWWYASCICGWRDTARGERDAERLGRQHRREVRA